MKERVGGSRMNGRGSSMREEVADRKKQKIEKKQREVKYKSLKFREYDVI